MNIYQFKQFKYFGIFKEGLECSSDLGPVHTTPFSNENDTVLFRIRLPSTLQRSENGSFRKRSPQWNDLKTVLFENAVFLVWMAKTILSENDDVTTTTPPGCRPLNREYTVIFSLLMLLEAHLTLLRQLFDFSRR